MKKQLITLFISLSTLAFSAQANEQIARENMCFKCHAIDSKKKAPSFQSIARNASTDEIKHTIRKGVSSFFGKEKMPANDSMSDAELKSVATWIKSLS
jgi:cytochrome c